jgi:methionyl-tRNA formyltransferase
VKKVIFMGTPDFAVPCLQALIDSGYEIPLVVTQPDRPAGRGQKILPPPVKTLAEKYDLKIYQPEKLKGRDEACSTILNTPCDFLVVAAFGQILPKVILNHPKVAPLNVHASLLPAYRGAAPIQRALMEGDQKTGITIQWMIEALDQGDILYQIPCAIHDDDTSSSLHDRLKGIGAQALLECLKLFESDHVVRRSQDARVGSYAAKLDKAESNISFNQPALFVHRAIMGLNPWPVAQVKMAGKTMKLYRSRFIPRPSDGFEPGTIVDTSDGEIIVACKQGCVSLLEVQLENRRRMSSREFLSGHPLPSGLILGAAT